MFIDTFHIEMQLMQRLDRWNEHVCMYTATEKWISSIFTWGIIYLWFPADYNFAGGTTTLSAKAL